MRQLDASKLQLLQQDVLRLNAPPLKLELKLLRDLQHSIALRVLTLLLFLLDRLTTPALRTMRFSAIPKPAKTGVINKDCA